MIDEKIIAKLYKAFSDEVSYQLDEPCEEPYDLSTYNDKKTRVILDEIDKCRNHSWIKEIWLRRKDEVSNKAMLFRGTHFNYQYFFAMSYKWAGVLKYYGLQKGDTFVAAIENTPEFPILMGATSLLGAKINLISLEMDADYVAQMIDNADFEYVFVTDMSLEKVSAVFSYLKSDIKVVVIPIDYSIGGINPYKETTDKYIASIVNDRYISNLSDERIISIESFMDVQNDIKGPIVEKSSLNDEYTITYTSGSTGWGRPKALIHRVRSYITMGRYHDPEVSGIPSMKGRTTLAMIKPMSDTDFMSSVSDTFMQGGIVALDPVNHKDYFIESLIINKPTLALATRTIWLHTMQLQQTNEKYENIDLSYLLVPMAVGEPLEANEEYILNKWLRKLNAGQQITKLPLTVMSTGGGDSEHGGIFISIFRAWQSRKPSHWGIKEPIGMQTYGMVEVKALKSDGTYCNNMESGRLVANSPCTMKGYLDSSLDEAFYVVDKYGKKWADLGTYGYLDKKGNVYVKGRIGKNDGPVPNYKIQEIILKDRNNIMSCEVISLKLDDSFKYIAHVQFSDKPAVNVNEVLENMCVRLENELWNGILVDIYVRIHSKEESFEILHTMKRNIIALLDEGISENCICLKDYI